MATFNSYAAAPVVRAAYAYDVSVWTSLEGTTRVADRTRGVVIGDRRGLRRGVAIGLARGRDAAAPVVCAAFQSGRRVGLATGLAGVVVDIRGPIESVSPAAATTLTDNRTTVRIDVADSSAVNFAGVVRVIYDEDDVTEIGGEVVYWRGSFSPAYTTYSTQVADPAPGVKLRLTIVPNLGWTPGRLRLRTVAVDEHGNVSDA